MGRLTIVWLLCVGVSLAQSAEPAPTRFEFSQTEMAIPIQIVMYCAENATASKAAKAAFSRFHALNAILSDYDPQSELRRLCDTSGEGKAVRVSDDLWRVLVRAEQLSQRSDGAFDATIGPVIHLWRSARQTKQLPPPESLAKALTRVGYRQVRLDKQHQTVELLAPKMRLDLGGIAKGYAVDEAMAALREHGVTRMLVNAGGNVGLGDPPPEKPGWRIGVAPPAVKSPPRMYLWLSRCALSTSGDLWQYALIDGVRYSHLIDPHTGMALTDHCSVTVVGPDGLSTDGLSSAVAILGPEKGLRLIENTPGAAAFIVRIVDGKEQTHQSSRWKELVKANSSERP
jgi:FAD:protein FMN transferase